MSTETDKIQKLVEIRLQKDDFERGLAETTKSLEKFEAQLNFEGSEKGLQTLGQSMLNLPLQGITAGVNKLGEAFSATGIAARKLIENFVDGTWNKFINMIEGFTIKPLTSGWEKYESKTKSVQTIMAATRKEFAGVSNQMEIVNGQLDRLTRFTDETSHKFTDMVGNIGKFTANGAKLEDTVTAMQGIATWASLSGGHVQEASRAMYNLSQAMGVGALKTMDWKSIELANMATAEFKETAIQTAVELKTLTKVNNQLWKDAKGNEVTVENFRDTLKSGWLDTNVLIGTLKKYGEFADKMLGYMDEMSDATVQGMFRAIDQFKSGKLDVAEFAKEVGISGERAHEILQELSKDEYDLGRRAFQASYETRTFKEAIEYVAEAVGSSWMKTWEIIFGNYEQAKDLWGEFSEWLYEVFVHPGEERNKLLKEWAADGKDGELGGRQALIEGLRSALEALKLVLDNVKNAWASVFPATTSEMLIKLTQKFASGMGKIRDALQFVGKGFDEFKKGVEGVKKEAEEVTKPLTVATDAITEFAKTVIMGKYGNNPDRQKTLEGMGLSFGVIQNEVNRLLDCSYRYEVTQEDIAKTSAKLAEINGTVAESNAEVAESVEKINYSDLSIGEKLNRTLRGLFSIGALMKDIFDGIVNEVVTPLVNTYLPMLLDWILKWTAQAGDAISKAYQWLKGSGHITEFFSGLGAGIRTFIDDFLTLKNAVWGAITGGGLESVNKAIETLKNFWTTISGMKTKLFEGFANAFSGIKEALSGVSGVETSLSFIDALAKAFNYLVELASPFTSALGEITNSFLDWFKALDFSKIGEWLGGIKQFFSDMWSSTAFDGIKGAFSSLKASISSISGSEIASSVLGALGKALSYIVEISRPITTAIGNMARSFVEWFKTLDFSRFSGVFDKLKTVLKDIWEFIKNISAKVLSNVNFGGIFDWISGKVNSLGSLTSISDLFSRFTGTFERFKTLLSSSGKEVGDFTVKTRELGETTKSMLGTHGIFDPILEQLGPIGDKLKKIGEVIYEAFTNLNMENLLGYLKSGATLFALTQFGKFLGSISTSTLLLGKTFISVSGIFDSITNKIGEFGKTIKDGIWTVATGFETLLVSTSKLRDSLRRTNNVKQVFMIALAVAALAGSIWLLATQVPPEKLWQSVGAVAALVVVLAVAVKLLGRGETESSKFDATLLAGAIVGFAAAVLLLIGAMKLLEHVEDFWTAYGKVAAIMALLGIIMAVLIFINKGSKVAGINAAAGMIGILFFAMAVKKLVEALVVLTNEDLDKLQSRMPILIGIIVATVIVAMLAKSVSKFGGSLTLIGIILSIWVFVKALKSLANEDWGLLYATMFKAVVLIGILMAFISFLSLLNNVVPNGSHLEQSRIAGALIGFGVAMVAMAAAMKIVSTINEKDYSRAMGAIFLIGAILIGFTWVARQGSGAHTAQLGVTFVGLSIALLTMVGCVWLLSKIAENSSKMWEGVVAIGVLMLAISIFTYSTKFATSSIGVLVALTVMVTMLSLAIVALAMLPTENAIAAAVGLGFVFVAFGEVLKQLGTLGKEVAKASLVIILIAALVVGIAAILWWMNENIQDPSRLVPIMESIGGVLLAIAGVTWILQYVNMQAAALGAVGMSGVILIIGALGALVAGLQWLCEKYLGFDLLGAVEKGLDLLVIIGGKLGETLAAFTAGATSKGEEVGNNLTKFVEAVTPFVEFLKSDAITPAAMRKLDPIKEFLNTLGELTIDPTLFQTLEGTDTTAVGKSFTELATGFKSYAEVLAGVENWDSVDKASRMIEALSSIAIPGYQPQWNTFLVGAGNFATSLVNMVDILNQAGFTKGDATKMEWFADAVASLATAGESVKGTGTIDWSTFTTGIDSMVHDLKKVAANTAILMSDASRTEAITYLVDVVGDLVELNNAMVPQGGLKTVLWEGERSWKSFTNGLVSFATSLKDFGDEAMLLTDDHKAGIDKAKELTDKLVEMEGTLPTVDGVIKQYFIGAKGTWESFGQGLAAYAYALVAFGEASTGISENQDDADKALALTTKFVNIATNGDLDPSRLYSLGEKIQLFGGQIKSFYDNTKDASSELGGVVQNIVNAFTSDVSALATANMETIGETIALLTTNGINAQSKLFIDSGHGSAGAFFNAMWDDISASKATNAGNMMLNYVRQTFNTFYELFISDGNTAASKFLYGISQKYNDAETSGRVLQTTFRQGINDYDQEFYDSGRQAAQGFVNGLKDEAVNKNAYDAGTALAQNALDGAKDKMKEHSPSKAMFELGSYGAEGFVLGLQDWYSTASFVGSSLSEKALDGLRSTISLMSEAISSDLDTDPVITPILDLSRVSAGAKILNGLVNANPTIGANRFTLNSTPQNEGENASNSGMTFIQNNYSPKALSRTEIYRQTKNQFSAAKGLVDGI